MCFITNSSATHCVRLAVADSAAVRRTSASMPTAACNAATLCDVQPMAIDYALMVDSLGVAFIGMSIKQDVEMDCDEEMQDTSMPIHEDVEMDLDEKMQDVFFKSHQDIEMDLDESMEDVKDWMDL